MGCPRDSKIRHAVIIVAKGAPLAVGSWRSILRVEFPDEGRASGKHLRRLLALTVISER
jgi:hypothetical protein